MTATCSPEVCVKVWDRRRESSKYRGVRFRQRVAYGEMGERQMLQERYPEWVDDWQRPPLLTDEELGEAEKSEVDKLDMERLRNWCGMEPDNLAFSRELRERLYGGTRVSTRRQKLRAAAMKAKAEVGVSGQG